MAPKHGGYRRKTHTSRALRQFLPSPKSANRRSSSPRGLGGGASPDALKCLDHVLLKKGQT